MSTKERRRLAVLEQVKAKQITLQAAAGQLGISERQAKRIYARFKADGDGGLIHKLRGKPGNRRSDPDQRQRVIELYREHYVDFGPTLAAEYLARRHELTVKPGTLRRWLIAEGLWQRRRKSRRKHQRRERRACFGELVQLDGSHHDWFEGRGERCVAMVLIDDATGWTHIHFAEAETTQAAMTAFGEWSQQHGLPAMVYPDRHSIYRINTEAADEIEARTGKRPRTQFGRAMDELGVRLTCANTPQAKGRVERANSTLQDRLVKAMRLAEISSIAEANTFVQQTFLPEHNARFAQAPTDAADAHVKVTRRELEQALCVKDNRSVGNDQCVSWEGQVLQLKPPRRMVSLAGKRVQVIQKLDGTVQVQRDGRKVPHQVLAARPARTPAEQPSLAERVAKHAPPWTPPANHAWRKGPATRRSRCGAGSATGSATPRPPLHPPHNAA